jgi:TIR domain
MQRTAMKVSAIYDVAISFAGEDRLAAGDIASGLVLKGLNVFYDEYVEADLWGKDLYVHLTQVYRNDSKFCLMLISDSYAAKQWTNHERRAAQSRAFSENREYILPLRLDDAQIDGILDTTGYIDFRKKTVEEITELIVKKVRAFNAQNGIAYVIVRAEEVFKNAGISGPNGSTFSDANFQTDCPTCQTKQRLSEAPISLDNDDTVYSCKNGCQPIVAISRPGIVAWPGRGYRVGAHVIRNAADIFVLSAGMKPVLIPAAKAALMKVRPHG